MPKPRDPDSLPEGKPFEAASQAHDPSYDFVSGNYGEPGGDFPIRNVEVSSADTAGLDLKQHFARGGLGDRALNLPEWHRGSVKLHGDHAISICHSILPFTYRKQETRPRLSRLT
jgi:hypothetical protein